MAFSKEIVSRKAKNDDEAIFDTEKKTFFAKWLFRKKKMEIAIFCYFFRLMPKVVRFLRMVKNA